MELRPGLSCLLLGLSISAVPAAERPPHRASQLPGQFQVNTFILGDQNDSAAAFLPSGEFVVAWKSYYNKFRGPSDDSIRARVFTDEGVPVGDDFVVDQGGTYFYYPKVASTTDGNFVVVWQSGLYPGIAGRSFATSGAPLGNAFGISGGDQDTPRMPSLAGLAGGDYVVVWESYVELGGGATGDRVMGRRVDLEGNVEPQFQVNSNTTESQRRGWASGTPDGGFIIVWNGAGAEPSVQGRLFDAADNPLSTDFPINTHGLGGHQLTPPRVSAAQDGTFAVTWQSDSSPNDDSDGKSIQARLFEPDGTALAAQFQVNASTLGDQLDPNIIALPGNKFAVFWEDTPSGDVLGRILRKPGAPSGGEFLVNSHAASEGSEPSAAAAPDGRFVVVFTGRYGPGDDDFRDAIEGNLFEFGSNLFADGFESGDLSAWSRSVP